MTKRSPNDVVIFLEMHFFCVVFVSFVAFFVSSPSLFFFDTKKETKRVTTYRILPSSRRSVKEKAEEDE